MYLSIYMCSSLLAMPLDLSFVAIIVLAFSFGEAQIAIGQLVSE